MLFFFFNDTATTEIYTLSLHDALPISARGSSLAAGYPTTGGFPTVERGRRAPLPQHGSIWAIHPGAMPFVTMVIDRKSTRLNSSHANISYAVFCLKKKKKNSTYKTIQY